MDPIKGGVENNYAYPPDPVNTFDLTGLCARCISSPTINNGSRVSDPKKQLETLKWLWQKRNEFVAWHQKNAPWLSTAILMIGVAKGGKPGGGGPIRPTFATSGEARNQAIRMGYSKTNSHPIKNTMGQEVFRKGNIFISRDLTAHNGGAWKMFDLKGKRLGTYGKDLSMRIGN